MQMLVFGVILVGFALTVRGRPRARLTAPLVFTGAGWALGAWGDPLLGLEVGDLHFLAELTLVLLLFHDASKISLAELRSEWRLVARLLGIGLPLAVLAGYATAGWLLPGLGAGLTLLVAAALAPTDAALGAPTVQNPAVPLRVRSVLNAESGLNDGLATPIVLAALVLAAGDRLEPGGFLPPIAIAVALGAVLGWLGGRAVVWSEGRGWVTGVGLGVVLLALPVMALSAASVLGGNGFVAAFVAGLAFAAGAKELAHEERAGTALEVATETLGSGVWFVFGASLGGLLVAGIRWQSVVFAVLALTVLRMVPVALALLGSGLRQRTVAFVGWFGPRGLASLVFALLSIEELAGEGSVTDAHAEVLVTIGLTVLLSVVAHGLTGQPLAERYGAWVAVEQPTIEAGT